MKFLLLLSITVIFVATGAEGLKCKCCSDTGHLLWYGRDTRDCRFTNCDDNGFDASIPVDCSVSYDACFTDKQGLKIRFFDFPTDRTSDMNFEEI